MPKLAVISLGCAKNLVDTEIMLGQLAGPDWEITQDLAGAELILINTCGFIGPAKEESVNAILEAVEYKKPEQGNCRTLAVAGCLVQRYADDLARQIPEVDYWIGLGEFQQIAAILKEPARGKVAAKLEAPFLNDAGLPRYRVTLPHTAYVKIADGCDHCCSYCAIPIIKGGFRSRRPEAIVAEVKELVRGGVREINLIAQDITMYGRDLAQPSKLAELLRRMISEAGPEWIRLLYAYPAGIDDELLQLMAKEPSICKYLDLPLQHINARILKLMNRVDPPEVIRAKLRKIREVVPEIALRTTFITGFPSESEAEFREVLDFVAEGHFNHMGAFAYSREEGTAAYRMKGLPPKRLRERRRDALLVAQQPVSERFLAAQVGRTQKMLIDRILPDGRAVGRSQGLAPEIDGVVYLEGYKGESGVIIETTITGNDAYNLFAKIDNQ
jgi:ribosomal protein S12 methylthiotransferase